MMGRLSRFTTESNKVQGYGVPTHPVFLPLVGGALSWKATAFIKPITHFPDGTKLRSAEKLLLFVLADDHNESRGYAWPSQKTLARNSLLSDRQVRRLLTKILSKGWPIRVETQKKAGKLEMSSSHYFFLFPDD
jgi:hypothetical protein